MQRTGSPPYKLFLRNNANSAWEAVSIDTTAELSVLDLAPTGLTGATAASRYVGGTASGAPGSGTFAVGDFIIDRTGNIRICTTAGSPGTWTLVGAASITTAAAALGADVTMTSLNTGYDGPSISLAAGTWVIWGAVNCMSSGAANFTAKIWDGTTGVSSGESTGSTTIGNGPISIPMPPTIVTPGSTTSYKITALANGGSGTNKIKAAALDNGAGNNATQIFAFKVA